MQVVTIFIQNNQKKLLIQKRSKSKGGKYGITSGHVQKKEEFIQGAIREIKEELGLKIEENELKLFYTKKDNKDEYHLYLLKKDFNIQDLLLQKEEVESVKWCTINEIETLIANGDFYDTQIEAYQIAKNKLEV